jgi:hypothetical protein
MARDVMCDGSGHWRSLPPPPGGFGAACAAADGCGKWVSFESSPGLAGDSALLTDFVAARGGLPTFGTGTSSGIVGSSVRGPVDITRLVHGAEVAGITFEPSDWFGKGASGHGCYDSQAATPASSINFTTIASDSADASCDTKAQIGLNSGVDLRVHDNAFVNCSVRSGGACVDGNGGLLYNTEFTHNTIAYNKLGAAMDCTQGQNLVENTVRDNQGRFGASQELVQCFGGRVVWERNSFLRNAMAGANANGAVVYILGKFVSFLDNWFEGNSGTLLAIQPGVRQAIIARNRFESIAGTATSPNIGLQLYFLLNQGLGQTSAVIAQNEFPQGDQYLFLLNTDQRDAHVRMEQQSGSNDHTTGNSYTASNGTGISQVLFSGNIVRNAGNNGCFVYTPDDNPNYQQVFFEANMFNQGFLFASNTCNAFGSGDANIASGGINFNSSLAGSKAESYEEGRINVPTP